MSLLRLLTAGSSLVGLKDSERQYRVTHRGLLPKFGSKANPFRTTIPREAARVAASAGPETAPPAASELPAPEAPAPAEASHECGCAAANTEMEKCPPRRAPVAKRESWLARWIALLKRVRRSRAGRKPARDPFAAGPAVQAELSLERVRVVRNDLTEGEVELADAEPPRARRGAVAPAVSATPARPVGAVAAWNRVSARIFGGAKR